MASFEREKYFVKCLAKRLSVKGATTSDASRAGETGIDVAVRLADGESIGVQVTELDPYLERGKARAEEKAVARTNPGKSYFMPGQGNLSVVRDAFAKSIRRKIDIASRHSFHEYDEVWLLVCAGVPELGAIATTFLITPWLSAEDMNSTTDNVLRGSKYDRCFLLPIVSVERGFFQWGRANGWEKLVEPEDVPREGYIKSLVEASEMDDWEEEIDRLCKEECEKVLSEFREQREDCQ